MISFLQKLWTAFCVGFVVIRIRLLLRLKTLPQVLDQLSPLSLPAHPDEAAMRQFVGYVDRWLQLFPYNREGNCFPRSLALYRFARELGYPVVFHCGVRRNASAIHGHAWLTLGPDAFYERGTQWQHFTVTFSYSPHPARDLNQTSPCDYSASG